MSQQIANRLSLPDADEPPPRGAARHVYSITIGRSAAEDVGAHLVAAFLSGRSPRTLRAYRQDLEDFRAFVQAVDIDEAADLFLRCDPGQANAVAWAYRGHLIAHEFAPATINRRLAALRSLVKLARTLGLVSWGIEVENVKTKPYRDTRGPGRQGFKQLLRKAGERGDAKAKRDRAAVRLLYDLALRRAEVVGLDLEDVDMPAGRVAVLGKGRREKEWLTVPEPTRDALREWIHERGEEPGPLFVNFDRAGKGGRLTGTSLYRIVRELGEDAGVKARPHGLRHAAITEAVKMAQANGIGLEEVRDFSRHADVRTLLIYRDKERDVQGKLANLVAHAAA